MASNKSEKTDPKKTVDLPPHGSRNPDPLTGTLGSHPIETGIGAAIGGAASGFAVGLVAGPIGAVIGAMAGGAVAGGYAGKGVGELIDPTTEDNWLRDYFGSEGHTHAGATADTFRPAYRYGLGRRTDHPGRTFDEAESDLREQWEQNHARSSGLGWDEARGAVRHAFGQADTGSRAVTVPVFNEEVVVRGGKVETTHRTSDVTLPATPEPVSGTAAPMSGLGTGGGTAPIGSAGDAPAGREQSGGTTKRG